MIVKDPLIVNPLPSPLTVSFVAPSSNIGRTTVLSNLAWLFARHGRGVLVLDLSTVGNSVHDYLGPFLTEEVPAEDLLGDRATGLLGGGELTAGRYAVGRGRLDVVRTDGFEVATAADLRDALRDTPYAYALIDAPSDDSPAAIAAITALSDRVAVCLSPHSSTVRDAARLTGMVLDQRPGTLPLVLIASQFGGDQDQIDRSRSEIHRELRTITGGVPFPLRTLPLRPYWDYLALLKEPPGSELREAYARLASTLVPEAPVTPLDVPSSLGNRYMTSMDLRADSGQLDQSATRIQMLYHPADRLHMEWLSRQLEDNGVETEPHLVTPDGPQLVEGPIVALVSPECDAARLGQALADRPVGAAEPELVVVTLPGALLPGGRLPYAMVDLTHEPAEVVAAGRLFGALGMTGTAQVVTDAKRPLLAGPEHVNQVPPRDLPFLGRDHEISALRDLLTRPGQQSIVVQAGSGMGKTALVREYYERFGAGYDTVWWIPAHGPRAIRRSLAQLGEDLAVRPRGNVVTATLDVLALDGPPVDAADPGRWLLIYDGVRDLGDLDGLLPAGGRGNVVITTGDLGDVPASTVLPLGPLEHKDAVDGLITLVDRATGRQATLSEQDAAEVVDAVEGVPIGVRLACVYLLRMLNDPGPRIGSAGTVMEYDETLREALATIRDTTASAVGPGALLDLNLELLGRDPYGRRTLRLAEMCAFLSPAGVDLRLLRAPAMLAQFSDADGEFTSDDIDRTMWAGMTAGLFSVRWADHEPLRTVPALQQMLLDRMTSEERAERCQRVRRGLAGTANALPWDVEAGMRTPGAQWAAAVYTELQRHIVACGAMEDDERDTREWVVRHFHYLIRTADQANLRYAEPLMSSLFNRWHRAHPQDHLTLRLANELTNALRGLGRFTDALELDELIQREFVGRLDRDHFRMLVVRRGIAADHRALGRFALALSLDQSTWRFFADTHGTDHPQTLTAGHNLAVSQSLAGQLSVALETERLVLQGRCRLLGETAWQTLWSEVEIGIYTRELGDFERATSLLFVLDRRMNQAELPREHPLRLRARRHWAIATRLAGDPWKSRGTVGTVLEAYEDLFGPDHPQSWATRLSLAAEEHDAGDAARAAELAGAVLAHYETSLGQHPFTAGARANVAVYLLDAGLTADAAAQAERAHEELLRLLGEPHPWTIGALLGRILVEVARDNLLVAAALADEAYGLALEYLPHQEGLPRHPCVLIAEEWRRLLGEGEAVDSLFSHPPSRRRHLEITIPET